MNYDSAETSISALIQTALMPHGLTWAVCEQLGHLPDAAAQA